MIFWLKNRRKEQWREKVEVVKTADDLQKINKNVSNIADLLNNPKPNRSEDNVQWISTSLWKTGWLY